MTNTTTNTILVIGSTGKTGKRVADQLENARHSRSARFPIRRHSVRLGGPADVGACAGRRRQGLHHLLPGPGRPRLGRRDPHADEDRRRGRCAPRWCCSPAVTRPKPSGPRTSSRRPAFRGRSCGAPSSRRTSTRGLARRGARGHGDAAGRRRAGAVRGRRRHRRRRGGRPDRRPPYRRALRADRAAAAQLP